MKDKGKAHDEFMLKLNELIQKYVTDGSENSVILSVFTTDTDHGICGSVIAGQANNLMENLDALTSNESFQRIAELKTLADASIRNGTHVEAALDGVLKRKKKDFSDPNIN